MRSKRLMVGSLACAVAISQPAIAASIVELRTNPACAQAFYQEVHALRQMTEVGKRLVPSNPPTPESCRDARQVVELDALHLRLETRMYAVCHQDGSAVLAAESARNAQLQRAILPRYCRRS